MQIFSETEKNRLRIAARFLRQSGHKFDGDNFYSMVISSINELSNIERERIRELVDWIEAYEVMEIQIYGESPPRSRARKSNPESSKKKDRASGATASAPIDKNIPAHEEKNNE